MDIQEDAMRPDDETAFREFAVAQWPALTRLAYLLVYDAGHAEDIAQTVLAKMWPVWGRVGDDAPEAYARRVLTNTAISWWRRRWHGERPTESLPEPQQRGYDEVAPRLSDRASLSAALRALPPRQRAAVVLRFAEDLSEQQVAVALNCSVGTVKSLTSRGLARLREDGVLNDERTLTNGSTQ
jgi:RNA polymerase sigma-70 factor, ECF subfamily